jgi:alpha/beta superfamily hydrolase
MRGEEEDVEIPVEDTSVDAKVCVQESPVVVIALHPWGPLGGSMHDPQPSLVCRTLAKAGCSTVRFNFRSGIGSGNGSVEDVRAVAEWFTKRHDGAEPIASQVLIVGYSYGSMIGAAAAAEIPQSIGYIVLGPPIDYSWALYVFNGSALRAKAADSKGKPKLLVVARQDQFCSEASFNAFMEELPEPKKGMVLDGIDHFSYFRKLDGILARWIPEAFGVADLETFGRSGSANPQAAVPPEGAARRDP